MLGTIEHGHVVQLLDALAAGDGEGLLQHIAALNEFAPDFDGVLAELSALLHQIAVLQAVPGAVCDERMDDEAVARLATALSAEDVQLFYQISLIGRRDLAIAPSPRLGFEMVLLRMLAFRPVTVGQGAPTSSSASPKGRGSTPTTAPKPRPTSPAAAEHAIEQPAAPRAKREVADDAQWHQLVEQLPLQGMVRVLATNCALIRREANTFHLELAPAHASLRNPKLEERLQEALGAFLGEMVQLRFTVTQPTAETPAALQERVSQDRLRSAQDAIAQDNHVKTLQEMFDARIVPDSIRPVD
jgi:DNA polymerase-3 subunit gamma/tau